MSTTTAHARIGVVAGPQGAVGGDVSPRAKSERNADRRHRLTVGDLQRFTKNLEIQLLAGVPIVRALEVQVDDVDPDALSDVCSDVLRDLETGATFGESLQRYACFPPLFSSMVQAGEFSGQLPRILRSVSEHLLWVQGIRKAIKKALTYPVVVLAACTGLILFILGFLMPSFEPLFSKVGDQLPTSAQVLRVSGAVVAAHWPWIVGGIVGGVVGIAVLAKTRPGQVGMRLVVDHAPWIRDVSFEVDVARLMKNLAVMLGAGIPLSQGIEMSLPSVATRRLRDAVERIHHEIESGTQFKDAFAATGRFSKLANNLVVVGEESGNLPEMFEHIGRHHDEVFTERVDRGLKMIEPIITLGLGVVVGGIAVTIIMTIYKAVLLSGR